jgi:hypothetical protein
MHLKLKKSNLNSFKAELPETELSRVLIGFGELAVSLGNPNIEI